MLELTKEYLPSLGEEELASKNLRMIQRLKGAASKLKPWPEGEDLHGLYIVTWNLQGGLPPVQEVKRLFPDSLSADMVVVATQECERSLALSLFCDGKEQWQRLLGQCLTGYQPVDSVVLTGLHLRVFIKRGIKAKAQSISIMRRKVGCWGMTGNKGGVQLFIELGGKTFSFLNMHLEHGESKHSTRVRQLITIMQQAHSDADFVFLMGDLNFRVDVTLALAHEWLKNERLVTLLSHDQTRKLQIGKAGFSEGAIEFPPTYKLTPGRAYDPQRIPAWTDRIFYKQTPNIQQLSYDSGPSDGSDHRPVYSQFLFRAKYTDNLVAVPQSSCQTF